MSGTHRIVIRNIEGEFLKDKDLIGKQASCTPKQSMFVFLPAVSDVECKLLGVQDPFVVFEYGDQKTQTKALKSAGGAHNSP